MIKLMLSSLLTTIMLLFVANYSNAQIPKSTANATVQVIQFHSEHRCVTCNLIEKLTKEMLQKHPDVPFTLINVDDKKNKKITEKFEAAGTALFIYNPKTGKKKDLTEFAFLNASSKPEVFKKGIEKEINALK